MCSYSFSSQLLPGYRLTIVVIKTLQVFITTIVSWKMALKQRGPTTSLAKRGQIVGLANHKGNRRLSLKEIAAITKISLSTCSDTV